MNQVLAFLAPLACTVCFGDAESGVAREAMLRGMNSGILLLLLVLALVLSAFAFFFLTLRRRARESQVEGIGEV